MTAERITAGRLMGEQPSHLVASLSDYRDLTFLRPVLEAADYTESGLRDLLKFDELSKLNEFNVYGSLWRAQQENSALAHFATLFLLGHSLPTETVAGLFEPAWLEVLLRKRILRAKDGGYDSGVAIYPCGRAYVVTDLRCWRTLKDPVYELGVDSVALARLTYRRATRDALDLCTGSGIHAILAASHCQSSIGVDINPRAITFAKINASLNGVQDRCKILQGNLYEPVADRTFDLVLANPPFVSAPDVGMDLHRWGGEDGEAIVRRIVSGLTTHLRPGGTFCMVTTYPIMTTSTYTERLIEWLGGPAGWGVVLLIWLEMTLEEFTYYHMGPEIYRDRALYRAEVARWMNMYNRLHVDRMGCAVIYIRRLPENRPGFTAERTARLVPGDGSGAVEQWLDALDTFHDPAWSVNWEVWRPRRTGQVWVHPETDEGLLEPDAPTWQHRPGLTRDEAWLAAQCDGRATAAEVAAAGSMSRERLEGLFRDLGRREIVV